MAIRVVARVRPQQHHELSKDVIVSTASNADLEPLTLVKIPNPKNESEEFTFRFSSVYDQSATQQQIFDNEVSPTIKHLFNGFDVTIFAYGSTGTGKTHTMRGGKTLAERGAIPRLLSGIYRKARKIAKESENCTKVEITLSYYEIYNDKVFDLFEASEKRTLAGLSLRDNGSKTVVVGLTERPCESLKQFETLYDQANINRSTSATKLNAASSRSHAILGIKLTVTAGDEMRISTASAIDLAGSEDNRRTQNGKERMVESASINKSLFTLAKCVEAISQKDARIPYRESKMTRILSLGQNNGLTVMILNLAPVRAFHLDTLSSLNFANRTKRIEVREIENEPIFKQCPRGVPTVSGSNIQRQPLRPLASTVHNASAVHASNTGLKHRGKSTKAFSVYSDKARHPSTGSRPTREEPPRHLSPLKRASPADPFMTSTSRPPKRVSPYTLISKPPFGMSTANIEHIIERKVTDILAARALDQPSMVPQSNISEEVQKRLDMLEKKIEGHEDGREQGLSFLLMAKQHAVRGEDTSALRMYSLALDFFPDNQKLGVKIEKLRKKIHERKEERGRKEAEVQLAKPLAVEPGEKKYWANEDNEDYQDEEICGQDYESDGDSQDKAKTTKQKYRPVRLSSAEPQFENTQTPRTQQLLTIINTRDVRRIRLLRGIGAKKAKAIIETLCAGDADEDELRPVTTLRQLGHLRGVGAKTVENMRFGFEVTVSE